MAEARFQLNYTSPDGTKWVKNMRDLAAVLGVGRDSLQRWRRVYDDFPSADAAGRYNVERFRTWMDLAKADGRIVSKEDGHEYGIEEMPVGAPVEDQLLFKELGGGLSARIKIADLKYRQFRAKKAEREFHILEKKYISVTDVSAAWEHAAGRIFQMIIAKASTALVNAGLSALDANNVAENVANEIFEDLSSAETMNLAGEARVESEKKEECAGCATGAEECENGADE